VENIPWCEILIATTKKNLVRFYMVSPLACHLNEISNMKEISNMFYTLGRGVERFSLPKKVRSELYIRVYGKWRQIY
jgi:hypothetical protein